MGTMSAFLAQSTPSPTGFDLLLSQSAIPALPGSQPAAPLDLSAINTPQTLFGPEHDAIRAGAAIDVQHWADRPERAATHRQN